MKKILLLTACVALFSCTDNMVTKQYGGQSEYVLKPDQKLINVTWKEDNIWVLTRPMNESDSAETYVFQEKSSYGIWEGAFFFSEVKTKVNYTDSLFY